MIPQGGEQADHGLWFPQCNQREVFVGFQRSLGDSKNTALQLNQMPFAGLLPQAHAMHRGGPTQKQCSGLLCSWIL